MRILLQSFETGLYLDTSGDWTNDSALAQSFPNTRQGAEFKVQRRLAHTFVVVLPEPGSPANVTRQPDETTMDAKEPAKPADGQGRAIQATMAKAGRSPQRKPATAKQQRGSNRHPCNLSL